MSICRRAFVLAAIATATLAMWACTLADGSCLRMSDCDDGTTCNEGRCVTAPPPAMTTLSTPTEAGAPTTSTPSTSTARDAASDTSTSDASSDAGDASRDAASDAASDG